MWYEETIRASEVVLCIITEHFHHKLTRGNHVIGRSVYNLMNDTNTAFRAVFLDTPKQLEYVPLSMRGSTCYCISSQHLTFEDGEFASLYAFLTRQNRTVKPKLGEMVVLLKQEHHRCTQQQLKAIYDANANLLTNNSSQDSTHMFGSEGGKEADADIDLDNYKLFRASSSDSSDDELVAMNNVVGCRICSPEYGFKDLWRGSATVEFIDRPTHAAVINKPLHLNSMKKEQQSNIMEFKQTLFAEKLSSIRLLRGYTDNLQGDPYDDRRLSKSQYSSSGICPNSQTTELLLHPPPCRDPPPYVSLKRPVKPSHEGSDADLSECLPCPSGFNCVPQSFYHQHSISRTSLMHLGAPYLGSIQSLQYNGYLSNSQLNIHDGRSNMNRYSSFRASYSLIYSSGESEFSFPLYRCSSDLSLTSAAAEPTSSTSSDLDCSEYPPTPSTGSIYGHHYLQLPLSKASGGFRQQHSTGHTPSRYPDELDDLSNGQYSNRRPSETECPVCGAVYQLDNDNQALDATLPSCRLEVVFVPPVEPLEPPQSNLDGKHLDCFQCSPLRSPHESIISPQPTETMLGNHRPRKRKRKCVIL